MIIVIKGANKKLMQKEIRSKIFIKKKEKRVKLFQNLQINL